MTTLGTRYPTLAFISGGVGEAEDGIPPQPFETFCYDSALMQAKIENFNIIFCYYLNNTRICINRITFQFT